MSLDHRVISLEHRADHTDRELAFLRSTGDTLKKSLEGIEKTLLQIQWLATGALATFVANEAGILKAVKLMFGIG